MRSIAYDNDFFVYIQEFRVEQCQLFLKHKCNSHRPYNCFYWHFMNQRRRRPKITDEQKFRLNVTNKLCYSYDPDIYCDIYDEQTGICYNGDSCPFVHRNTGDTEKKYHWKYYKVVRCFYEMDNIGHCTKHGPHCYMVHDDENFNTLLLLKRSQYLNSMLETERIYNDNVCWNDIEYVLENYKTTQCDCPTRVCRQGYACPQYHNPRDRRRNPFKFNYRSTPCPNVKQSEEWNEPHLCEMKDLCQSCHTRTEQQFHPDIYKSTRCHDILSSYFCPRGTFCAFAHGEKELKMNRDQHLSKIMVDLDADDSYQINDNRALSPINLDELFSLQFPSTNLQYELDPTQKSFILHSTKHEYKNISTSDFQITQSNSFKERSDGFYYNSTHRMSDSLVNPQELQLLNYDDKIYTKDLHLRRIYRRRPRRKQRTSSGSEINNMFFIDASLLSSDIFQTNKHRKNCVSANLKNTLHYKPQKMSTADDQIFNNNQVEAMISRNLENIGIDNGKFKFEGDDKSSVITDPQTPIQLPSTGDNPLANTPSLSVPLQCDVNTKHYPFVRISSSTFGPVISSEDLQIQDISDHPISQYESFYGHKSILSDPSVPVDIASPKSFFTAHLTGELFHSERDLYSTFESHPLCKILLQYMQAQSNMYKSKISHLEAQLKKSVIEREQTNTVLKGLYASDKDSMVRRSIWAMQPAEKNPNCFDKDTQTMNFDTEDFN